MRPTARFTFAATLLAATVLGSVSHAALIAQRPAMPEGGEIVQVSRSDGDASQLIRTAVAQRADGNTSAALKTLSKAIEIDPGSADAHGIRALAQFDRADFAAAAESFRLANERTTSLRVMLGRYLALGRIGQNADGELQAIKSRLSFAETGSLDYVVAGYFLGQRTLSDLSAAAQSIEDVCTVQFYRSEYDLMQNRFEAAAEGLRSFADACPSSMMEYPSAQAELKRLGDEGYLRSLKAGKPTLKVGF